MNDIPSDLRRKKPTVSLDALREMFSYDPTTGHFTRNRRMGRHQAGTVAGGVSDAHGYVFIGIAGQLYRAHRLAWFYHHGEWPPVGFEPDHKNGRRADNRIENLRLATRTQNIGNGRTRSDNSSGCRGVSFSKQKRRWRAVIANQHIGFFKSKTAAVAAAQAAAREYYGEFARAA